MHDLSVTFAGKRIKSPIGVASHALKSGAANDPQKLADHLIGYVEQGAGFVYTPFVGPEHEHPKDLPPSYRFMNIYSREPFREEGLLCAADANRIMCRLDDGLKAIDILKKRLPQDVAIIANIIGPGADAEGWAEHAKCFEQAGADMIEMNVSCPLPAGTADGVAAYAKGELSGAAGALLGDSGPLLFPVVGAVVKAVEIPVGVKMTPETGFPRIVGIAEGIKNAGATFITGVNGPISCGPPDIYNGGKGRWVGLEDNMACSAHGPWTRFLCYRNLFAIATYVPDIELAAVGGLVEPEHVVEAMMLGARICEFSSGLLWRGTDFLDHTILFLNEYMNKVGYQQVEDFIGSGIKYFKPLDQIDWRIEDFVSQVDDRKCIRCGICTKGICEARTLPRNQEADLFRVEVNEELCYGCGLCEAICPAHAISIIEKKHKVLGVSIP